MIHILAVILQSWHYVEGYAHHLKEMFRLSQQEHEIRKGSGVRCIGFEVVSVIKLRALNNGQLPSHSEAY